MPTAYQRVLAFARAMRKNPTVAERFFWEKVRKRGFCNVRFQRQYIIQWEELTGKKKFYIADFYCHTARLIIEIDGPIHRSLVEADLIREEQLRELGFEIIRFSNETILNSWDLVDKQLSRLISLKLENPQQTTSYSLTPNRPPAAVKRVKV